MLFEKKLFVAEREKITVECEGMIDYMFFNVWVTAGWKPINENEWAIERVCVVCVCSVCGVCSVCVWCVVLCVWHMNMHVQSPQFLLQMSIKAAHVWRCICVRSSLQLIFCCNVAAYCSSSRIRHLKNVTFTNS